MMFASLMTMRLSDKIQMHVNFFEYSERQSDRNSKVNSLCYYKGRRTLFYQENCQNAKSTLDTLGLQ